ncbi:DUF2721 domain-containing protein [Pelagicoccus mobilis]|uniref:DUF2721 domain-containing protein n=1 Tax=Pelagicoccus mobilis TaxID=415221 RepID=A0A934VT13_9BACT|nr:DUF2721 domain-containing protein [Pelagicoccus mobilis]MBK1879590.1 DUF2721 domain-containing protein [Pelagicoccus mobilis]
MTDLFDSNLSNYQAVIAPFVMMTSCATLVWALQTRFSRVVQAIRSLTSEGKRDNIDYSHSLEIQITWLKNRGRLLRNSIAGFYLAMVCFLLSAMVLAASLVSQTDLAEAVVALFLSGLALMCFALVSILTETSRSYGSLAEETRNR